MTSAESRAKETARQFFIQDNSLSMRSGFLLEKMIAEALRAHAEEAVSAIESKAWELNDSRGRIEICSSCLASRTVGDWRGKETHREECVFYGAFKTPSVVVNKGRDGNGGERGT